MLELLGLAVVIVFVFALAIGVLKAVFWLLLLPLKLGFALVKGVFGLILFVPLALLSVLAACSVLPAVAIALALPVLLVVGVLALLVKAFA